MTTRSDVAPDPFRPDYQKKARRNEASSVLALALLLGASAAAGVAPVVHVIDAMAEKIAPGSRPPPSPLQNAVASVERARARIW
jgi:hypothetical protein